MSSIESVDSFKYDILLLTEGQGATFSLHEPSIDADGMLQVTSTLNPKIRNLNALGRKDGTLHLCTWDCITCVGIFFHIGRDLVFFAHLNMWPDRPEDFIEPFEPLSDEEFEDVRIKVRDRLKQHAGECGWYPAEVDMQTVFLFSARPNELGQAVAAGVSEFFGFLEGERFPVRKAHGVVLDPRSTDFETHTVMVQWLDVKSAKDEEGEDYDEYTELPEEFESHGRDFFDEDGEMMKADFAYRSDRGWESDRCPEPLRRTTD